MGDRLYMSRPGTEGRDRIYFFNPDADFNGDKATYFRLKSEALEEFYRQAWANDYLNTRNWEEDPT